MIITIHALGDIDTARLTWSQRQLVRYLRGLHERQGDVLLFGMQRAIRVTGLDGEQIERGIAMLARRRAVVVETTEAMAA